MISSEKILETENVLHNLNDAETNQLVRRFERKQPGIFVYLAGLSQREELNEEEEDHLFTLAIVSWKVVLGNYPRLRKVRVSKLEEVDEGMIRLFDRFSAAKETPLYDYGKSFVSAHQEPRLIEFLLNRVLNTEIRDEMKPIVFFALAAVVEAFLESTA